MCLNSGTAARSAEANYDNVRFVIPFSVEVLSHIGSFPYPYFSQKLEPRHGVPRNTGDFFMRRQALVMGQQQTIWFPSFQLPFILSK
jgi:hypothetical protein